MSIQPYFGETGLRRRICCWWAGLTCVLKRRYWAESTKAKTGRNTHKRSFKFVSIGIEGPIEQGDVRSVWAKLAMVGNVIITRGIKCFMPSADRLDLDMNNLDMTVQNPKWHISVPVNPLIMVTV